MCQSIASRFLEHRSQLWCKHCCRLWFIMVFMFNLWFCWVFVATGCVYRHLWRRTRPRSPCSRLWHRQRWSWLLDCKELMGTHLGREGFHPHGAIGIELCWWKVWNDHWAILPHQKGLTLVQWSHPPHVTTHTCAPNPAPAAVHSTLGSTASSGVAAQCNPPPAAKITTTAAPQISQSATCVQVNAWR